MQMRVCLCACVLGWMDWGWISTPGWKDTDHPTPPPHHQQAHQPRRHRHPLCPRPKAPEVAVPCWTCRSRRAIVPLNPGHVRNRCTSSVCTGPHRALGPQWTGGRIPMGRGGALGNRHCAPVVANVLLEKMGKQSKTRIRGVGEPRITNKRGEVAFKTGWRHIPSGFEPPAYPRGGGKGEAICVAHPEGPLAIIPKLFVSKRGQ